MSADLLWSPDIVIHSNNVALTIYNISQNRRSLVFTTERNHLNHCIVMGRDRAATMAHL